MFLAVFFGWCLGSPFHTALVEGVGPDCTNFSTTFLVFSLREAGGVGRVAAAELSPSKCCSFWTARCRCSFLLSWYFGRSEFSHHAGRRRCAPPTHFSVSEAALRLWYRPMGAEQQISIFDDAYFECRHARARRVLIADAFNFILISTLGEEVDRSHASFVREVVAAGRITMFSLHALLLLPLLSLRSSRVVMLVQHLWTWDAAATTTRRGCF